MTYPKIFAQQPGETSHDYTPCFSTAAAAAPPSASHPSASPGQTPLHKAALKGHAAVVEQLISAGAKVDAAESLDGCGPGRVFGSFWEWLWRGDGRGSYIGS